MRHHLPLLVASIGATALLVVLIDGPTRTFRLSMATAYLALALLAATLAIGPLRVIRRRPVPLSLDLRRDLGIWAGIAGIAHAIVGLFVHLGNPLLYFFRPGSFVPRVDAFGLSNDVGLAAALIFAVLLATSNDASLRSLGAQRWKSTHRWVYAAAALMVVHGIVYQVREHRTMLFVLVFAAAVLGVLALQSRAFGMRRQHADAHARR